MESRIALRPSDGGVSYLWKMDDGRRKMSGRPEGFTMLALRAWLWFVPIGMIIARRCSRSSRRWTSAGGLFAVMIVMGVFGLALLVFHLWLMYRFGGVEGGR